MSTTISSVGRSATSQAEEKIGASGSGKYSRGKCRWASRTVTERMGNKIENKEGTTVDSAKRKAPSKCALSYPRSRFVKDSQVDSEGTVFLRLLESQPSNFSMRPLPRQLRIVGVGFLDSHKVRFFSFRFWRQQAFFASMYVH